jgi:hypothetical protein
LFSIRSAGDPLDASDVRTRIEDGLPNTLEEWIPHDGLVRFKIKLNGGNLDADFERVVRIDRIVSAATVCSSGPGLEVSLDFNEGCPNVAYLLNSSEESARPRRRDSIESSTSSNRPHAICRKIART